MARSSSRSSKTDLQFNKPIISTAKDPIATKELLNRLQVLSDELSGIDQDKDVSSFQQLSADLTNKKLLYHTNVGVQAFTCCAIADILRINAPNAPFTAAQLTDIFKSFFKQFKRLSEQENPYFQQQAYILKRLAEVRSVILITDLPNSEDLIESVFETFYTLSTKDIPSRLEPLACDILSEVIAESETIPTKVLVMILNKFFADVESSGIKSITTNSGLNFSIQICENNIDRLSRQVAQYFSEILYDNAKQSESVTDLISSSTEKLNKIHKLSVQIWKHIPSLLSSAMGLIDDELKTDDENIRSLATETIGQMLGSDTKESSSFVNFVITHRETWTNWLKRTTDVSPSVRDKWVSQLPAILNSTGTFTTEVNTALTSCLHKCLLDTDEKVRESACACIDKVSFENFTNRVCNKTILQTLFQLTREKQLKTRNLSIRILASLYDKYLGATNSGKIVNFGNHQEDESNELQLLISEGIPNQILSLVYINDVNITASVDLILFEKLIPINETNTVKLVDRIVSLYKSLDDKGKQSFLAMNRRQQQVSKVIETFIETSQKYNQLSSTLEDKENLGEDKNNDKTVLMGKLDKIIKWICVSFPEGLNTYAVLERFYKLNKGRFFHLLKVCISPNSDIQTVRNSIKELLSKLSDSKNIRIDGDRNNITTSDMVTNIKLLLMRSSILLYNKSNIVELINYSKDINHPLNVTANKLLEEISTTVPEVFKNHFNALIQLITNNDGESGKAYSLRTLYHFIKKFPDIYPQEESFIDTLKNLASTGTPLEAKYSIEILGLSKDKELYCSSVLDKVYPLDLKHENFATHLSALAELFLVEPILVQDKAGELTTLIIQEVFLKNRVLEEDAIKNEGSWLADDVLDTKHKSHSTLYEKLLALRLFVNRLRGLDKDIDIDSQKEEILTTAQPVLKLLMSFIGNGGEIVNKNSENYPTPELYKSKLRLVASLYLLKLAQHPIYSEMISSNTIRRLTFLLTDSNLEVRSRFMSSLQKKLASELISEKFLAVIFFSALEPTNELKNSATMWVLSLLKRQESKGSIKFEKCLVRIIHILAHHEQFLSLLASDLPTNEEKEIAAFTYATKFITFFVSLVAKSENISLLYYFASRAKQHRDATIDYNAYDGDDIPKEAINLYRVAELAQFIIKEYADQKNWPTQTWPGKLKLPTDIYAPMSSVVEVQKVITRVFISERVQVALRGPIKKKLFGSSGKRKLIDNDSKSKEGKDSKSRTKIAKVTKRSNQTVRKERKEKLESLAPSRKSNREKKEVNYADSGDSDSDDE
ncbi:precocious dissociation of sister chromatids [Scheffersomyces coipomensis]|uniref:precocious dissociation of sister chromatids n=1 Tax=Scheffersomyces coipomensis TaxID=1788519 RepID=UPI00315D4ED9